MPTTSWRDWAPIPLRLIVGYGFFAHGAAKLERGPDHFAAILAALHVPLPALLSWATIVVEVVGAIPIGQASGARGRISATSAARASVDSGLPAKAISGMRRRLA